jgi:septum formation protein
MKSIILASKSPRRKELLKMLGLKFRVVDNNYKEKVDPKLKPEQLAKKLSLGKAKAMAAKNPRAVIIAADTIVVLKKESLGKHSTSVVLGKPHTGAKAKQMLKKLSGKMHLVITGLTIIDTEKNTVFSKAITTKVYFKKLTPLEIDAYIKTKEPLDKAGGYAIQGLGSLLIKKIEGDYFNIVGLPLNILAEGLKKSDIDVVK